MIVIFISVFGEQENITDIGYEFSQVNIIERYKMICEYICDLAILRLLMFCGRRGHISVYTLPYALRFTLCPS